MSRPLSLSMCAELKSHSFFSLSSTRIMSSPICLMSQKGITYSFSCPKNPQTQPGPGTMIAIILPVQISKSTSPTKPRRLQSFILITSFASGHRFSFLWPPESWLLLIYVKIRLCVPLPVPLPQEKPDRKRHGITVPFNITICYSLLSEM